MPVKVTIKGGMRSVATAKPLKAPIARPTPSINSTPTGVAHGLPASQPVSPFMASPSTTLATAMMAQAERSMPPVINTTVCPQASTSNGSSVNNTLARFSRVARVGVIGHRTKNAAAVSTSTRCSDASQRAVRLLVSGSWLVVRGSLRVITLRPKSGRWTSDRRLGAGPVRPREASGGPSARGIATHGDRRRAASAGSGAVSRKQCGRNACYLRGCRGQPLPRCSLRCCPLRARAGVRRYLWQGFPSE